MKNLAIVTAIALAVAAPAQADAHDPVARTVAGAYDDVMFDVETAITNAGLVIDAVNHVGDMLERTKEDVGGSETLFTNAKVFNFCSADVSRTVMEADPMNLQFCPYTIFVMEQPGTAGQVTVGRRSYPSGAMEQVSAMLDSIIDEALSDY
jgi:uncharacterized protein (DUF302 family)